MLINIWKYTGSTDEFLINKEFFISKKPSFWYVFKWIKAIVCHSYTLKFRFTKSINVTFMHNEELGGHRDIVIKNESFLHLLNNSLPSYPFFIYYKLRIYDGFDTHMSLYETKRFEYELDLTFSDIKDAINFKLQLPDFFNDHILGD